MLARGGVVGGTGGWAGWAGAADWAVAAVAAVTDLVEELTTDPAALVTEEAALVRGLLTIEAGVGPVSAEAADVTAESPPGGSSPVAAWACLEKRSNRNRIPAAAIANCATRTAARCASSCGIASSYPQRTEPRTQGAGKAPDQPCTAVEDEAFCTAITVHHRRWPNKRYAAKHNQDGPSSAPDDGNDLRYRT